MPKLADDSSDNATEDTQQVIPIHMNKLRCAFDYFINLDQAKGIQYREAIRDNRLVMIKGIKNRFKFSLLKVSEEYPFLLIIGILCWTYLVVYGVLKLTILV